MNNFDKRKLVLDQLKWLAVYMGIAFVIAILLPFPVDWLVALPAFLLINLYGRKLFFRKLNMPEGNQRILQVNFSQPN